jgi:ABC-type uncharacterized transport system YnjBCD permease subunit
LSFSKVHNIAFGKKNICWIVLDPRLLRQLQKATCLVLVWFVSNVFDFSLVRSRRSRPVFGVLSGERKAKGGSEEVFEGTIFLDGEFVISEHHALNRLVFSRTFCELA